MFKKNFIFIILISALTLIVLVVGALTLYKDTSKVFLNDGYIIETTTKTNTKYYFSANTKYKENVEEKIAFEDKENNKVSVNPASFIHYSNGNIAFLQKGALVNLADITNPMVSYYNITPDNTILYTSNHYNITSNNKQITIDSFVGRINDNKYIIAGKDLTLRIPTEATPIIGEYFEINYIEEGIVKIDNENNSYQVTAQDSYIYVGNNIIISLNDGKISYDNDVKMLLSQITINGDENINLDVPENNSNGGGSGNGEGEGTGEDGEGTGEENTSGEGTDKEQTEGNEQPGNPNIDNSQARLQIELIKAEVTSTTIDLSMQMNNSNLAKGTINAILTNVSTGEKEEAKVIAVANGTFNLDYSALVPNTNYSLVIAEIYGEKEIQYFQKNFITRELGLTLEKTYATDTSLAYKLIFAENSEVTKAKITIYDNNGTHDNINPYEYTVSATDLNNNFIYNNLKSNTSYSINVDTVWINNTAYSNLYNISRIDTTLKETPKISGVNVTANAEEVKFTLSLGSIIDKDKSIISYTYNVYLADDITLDNLNPEVKYQVTKTDSDPLVLNLNEIDELKTGVDYRAKVIAKYNDNEMIREVATDYSSNFLIRSKPKITFELKNATMNKVEGTITLVDANCTVPIKGRACSNKDNTFTLRYYELSEEETTDNDTIITFDYKKLTSPLSLTDLKSNTTYAVKVFGNYYDDDNVLHANVQIGDAFYVTTDKSENIYFEVIGDNTSGFNKDGSVNLANVVTFDAKLSAPQNSTIMEEISTLTLNLYSGRYNTKDKLIGTYEVTDKNKILDMFNNMTITNSLFTDTTTNKLGKLNTIENLIKVTNNLTGTLNNAYTVELTKVYDITGKNEITVENNIYTFNLTPSYYLDARIATNPKATYITVTEITKEQLAKDEEEYEKVAKDVKNLADLNDDTVVGLTIENSLSDIFVDSAYTYEKATVYYTICNNTLNDCDSILKDLTDDNLDNDEAAKEKIKFIEVNMGNKYQPKEQTIYLDASTYTNAKKYFLRGYNYKVGFYIDFTTEDGSNPKYTNDALHKTISIEKQSPLYTQYISKSTSTDITYRYSFNDVDSALTDNNFYYTIGEDKETYHSIDNSLIDNYDTKENTYHEVTIPINNRNLYSLYYARKNTDDKVEYVSIATNNFEGEYLYNNNVAYTILDSASNNIKIKLDSIDVTNRAIAYKVVINSLDKPTETPYIKYFLASKLSTLEENTGLLDQNNNPVINYYKYITIDYAQISKFMGQNLTVNVYSYFDNGIIGYHNTFNQGFILKNNATNKYLNIFNSGSNDNSSVSEANEALGLYLLKEDFTLDKNNIYIYNKLIDTKKYNPSIGATYYDTKALGDKIGINFNLTPTNGGMILTNNNKDYVAYDLKALNEAKLITNNYNHKFDTIVPTIKVTTNNNTINSIVVDINASGIYGNKQFSQNKAYIKLYSTEEASDEVLLETLEALITISGDDTNGYKATIDTVEFKNLKPDTKYYFKVYAYINNKLTQLYDSSSTSEYITKTYETKTLGAIGLIEKIKFHVKPSAYSGETSTKTLTWKLNLKNTKNYKIRFELYAKEEKNNEELSYKQVRFDGNNINTCNKELIGNEDNGYITNDACYIIIDNPTNINKLEQEYIFSNKEIDDSFVFGDNYYKLIVYAIPYTNNTYIEEDKIILYQNDSLTTTTSLTTINGIEPNIHVKALEKATFTLKNITTGYNKKDSYYISFIPKVEDKDKVIKYGSYTIKLKNENGDDVEVLSNITADISVINQEIKFTGLNANTLYYIELSHEAYRNNVGYTELEKQETNTFNDFLYTPISNDITLGAITASSIGTSSIMLTYNGASSNLSKKIVRIDYTISLVKGSSTTTGTYKVDTTNNNIFTVTTDKAPRFTIDTKESTNTNFTFKSGNTYTIRTQYYYDKNENGIYDKEDELLTDQLTGNTTYTTILNL